MREYKIVEPMPQYGKDVARIVYVPDEMIKQIRTDAVDDFVQKVKEHQYVLSDVINSRDYGMFTVGIEQIAEELKENFDTVN